MKKLILLALIAAGAWWHFVGGRRLSEDNVKDFYRDYEIATLQRKPEANGIEISPDKKSASADISSTLDVAGSIMNFATRSTQTLIRKNGKVPLQRSESRGTVRAGS